MTIKATAGLVLFGTLMLMGSCATVEDLQRRYSGLIKPEISLVSLAPLPRQGFEQRFQVGLRFRNPNAVRIAVDGVSLRVELNDFPVLSGVSKDMPALAPYSESTASVTVGTELVDSLALLLDLIETGADTLEYRVQARLAVDLPKRRRLLLERKGYLPLTPTNTSP